MNKIYLLAKQFYLDLRSERYLLCDYSCCNLAVEKYLGILWLRFFELFYGEKLELKSVLYFYPPRQDFFESFDKDYTFPLITEGYYQLREEIDYGESIVAILLKCMFRNLSTWQFDYFIANINKIYSSYRIEKDDKGNERAVYDETIDNCDNCNFTMRIFKQRSLKELISDCYIVEDFFAESDLDHIDMKNMEFESKFRDLFSSCSYDYNAKYILLKSFLIPDFLKLKQELLDEKEKQLYLFIKSVISSMTETYNCYSCNFFLSANLSAAYFIYNVSVDYNDACNDSLGVTELYPDLFLAPYLIDEGIKMLDRKHHFIGGGFYDSK